MVNKDKVFYWQCSKCNLILVQLVPGQLVDYDILDMCGSSYFQDENKTKINPIMDICGKCNNLTLHIPVQCSREQLVKKVRKYGYQERKYRLTFTRERN